MKPFLASKRRMYELGFLALVDGLLGLTLGFEFTILFTLGFVWNWVAGQDLSALFENRRYRFSMVKTVVNLQLLLLVAFFENLPAPVRLLVKILPAGTFWALVVWFNDSHMPWWATFIGSLVFEALQFYRSPSEESEVSR